MDEQRQIRRRRTPAEVQHMMAEFVSSGMGQDEFCRSRGICRSTLYRCLKRRRQEESVPATQLVPVEVVDARRTSLSRSTGLTVLLENGRKLEVGTGFDAGTLQQLLSVLERE